MAFYYPTRNRDQLARTAAGIISDNGNPAAFANASSPTSQMVYGALVGLRAGDLVTGIMLRLQVPASGTAPTTGRGGILDKTGKVLAISGNVNAAASWLSPCTSLPLAAPYTVLADDGYFAAFVVNGTWSVTQPTLIRGSGNAVDNGMRAFGSSAPSSFQLAAQADLPAVGASLAITAGSQLGFYMAFY